jgi:putative restriction endonuclease
VHRQNQAGISGTEKSGAESIVVSGGYEDDIDDGDIVVYTGHGGRDPNTGKQIADQELTRGNLALAKNVAEGTPVRVVRKVDGQYRYDGLYRVEKYWPERGRSGFVVYRYRLIREGITLPEDILPVEAGPAQKKAYTVTRIVRDTQVAKAVKLLHSHKCQICGTQLLSPTGAYAEAAHIRPLGKPHDGPDSADNILCLCPNHHVLFDLFGFSIEPDLTLIGIPGRLRTVAKHKLSPTQLAYHRQQYEIANKV